MIYPPKAGPISCPTPKREVTKPAAVDLNVGATYSPAVTTATVGMLDIDMPKRMAEQ